MKQIIQHTLAASLVSLISLMSSTTAMAIQCPVTLNFVALDVATQTLQVTGSGFSASYSGDNPVIIAILAEQAFKTGLLITYTLDSATCIEGGNITAAAF